MPDTPAATASQADKLPPPTALKSTAKRSEEPRPNPEVLEALAKGKSITEPEAISATDWFLAEEQEDDTVDETHSIDLNVGVDEEKWITWIARPIDSDELRRIQRQSAVMRKRSKQDDLAIDQIGNIRVIIEGSVEPDIRAIAEQRGEVPEAVVLKRFKRKPGLIAQLAGRIMALSGFDDDDIRDSVSAKNS